eukprot:6130744-Prymnesium_polylepis.1
MRRRYGHAFGARIALASEYCFSEGAGARRRRLSRRIGQGAHVGIARVPGHGGIGSWWCGGAHRFRPGRPRTAGRRVCARSGPAGARASRRRSEGGRQRASQTPKFSGGRALVRCDLISRRGGRSETGQRSWGGGFQVRPEGGLALQL